MPCEVDCLDQAEHGGFVEVRSQRRSCESLHARLPAAPALTMYSGSRECSLSLDAQRPAFAPSAFSSQHAVWRVSTWPRTRCLANLPKGIPRSGYESAGSGDQAVQRMTAVRSSRRAPKLHPRALTVSNRCSEPCSGSQWPSSSASTVIGPRTGDRSLARQSSGREYALVTPARLR